MRKIITCVTLILVVQASYGQMSVNNRQIADAYFSKKDYYAAAMFYKKALNISSDTTALHLPYAISSKGKASERTAQELQELYFKLAEASRLYHNFADAERYYAIVTDQNKFPNAQYWYGVSLSRNQKYDLAIEQLVAFLKTNSNSALKADAEAALSNARFATAEIKNPGMVKITKLNSQVNNLGSNYAAVKWNDGLMFTSSRPITPESDINRLVLDSKSLPVTKSANPYINTLYFASNASAGQANKATMAEIKRPQGMEFGAPTITADGKTLYFTAWNSIGETKKYSIWKAERNANVWSVPTALNSIVNDGSNAKQPFVTEDGKYLLFSSDRAGGTGGFDLWYVALRADGSTGIPVNLGLKVNTAKDEEAPYYNLATSRLIYSSNGKVGFGGLDLYQSFGDFATWSEPENMGYPFNSSKDDVYFSATDQLGTEGYVSSDRASECCLEIFQFASEKFALGGTLSDCNSEKPLANANVSLSFDGIEMKTKTDANGRYNFTLVSRKGFQLAFSKENYFAQTVQISKDEMLRSDIMLNKDLCLTPFKVDEPIVLKNIYFEFNSFDLNVPSMETLDNLVKILSDNADISIELSAHTDSVGSDEYNFNLSSKRAQACVDYIVSKGIPSSRITAKGYGETMPVAPNSVNGKDNPQGRALNRRTEFKVLGQQ